MLHIAPLHFPTNYLCLEMDYLHPLVTIKNKVCRLGKEIFDYLATHQYALSAAIWTSLFIQMGVTASSIVSMEYIDELESCINTFCEHSNMTDTSYYLFSGEVCSNWEISGHQPFSSLEECMSHLNTLYYSYYIDKGWNAACPSLHLSTVKKVNKYMAQCFNRLCSEENPITFIDKNSFDWCSIKEVKKSKRALKAITKQLTSHKINQWTEEDILKVSVDLFFDLTKKSQSMLASITSAERFGTLASKTNEDLVLIKKGLQQMLSSPIELIKGLIQEASKKNPPLKVTRSLLAVLEKIQKFLPAE